MNFEYYYGTQADQFSFIRIPRILLLDEAFSALSLSAKVLYSVRIAGEYYPAGFVKGKLLKLNYSHIEYVLECMDKNTTKVRNIKQYLLAALFNAPSTIGSYYKAAVNHDMPQYAN